MPRMIAAKIVWPVEDTGKNSVIASTIANMIALKILRATNITAASSLMVHTLELR